MNRKNETKAQQKRRFLLVLPLLLVPFVTIAFSLIQSNKPEGSTALKLDSRLKTDLPGINVKDRPMDKMSYYELAKADSLKRGDQIKKDPYYQQQLQFAQEQQQQQLLLTGPGLNHGDPHEAMVFQKINSINAALNHSQQQQTAQVPPGMVGASNKEDIDRLEKMMQLMYKDQEKGQDPELQQLNGMLEKLMDIQHPERVQEQQRKNLAERKGQVYSISAEDPENMISVLQPDEPQKTRQGLIRENGFYSLEDLPLAESAKAAIKAVVHETQVLVNGSVVKMRLIDDLFINGILVPKDNFVFGTATLTGERLSIAIDNIRAGNSILPVKLSVYDMDGLDGIRIPGAISREVAKQSGSNALQSFGMGTGALDQSLSMQAAAAGIELTKNLVGKKIKMVKVTIKAGYQILFKDENHKDQN